MTEWTTIRVKKDAKKRAEELKDDNTTWSEWMADEARAPDIPSGELAEELKNELSMVNEVGVNPDMERLYARIDELESTIPKKTADELAGRR